MKLHIKKKKKWFDDWNVSYRPYAGKRQKTIWKGYGKGGEDVVKYRKSPKPNGYYRIDLPHSFTDKLTTRLFTKNKHDDKRIYELVMIIDCCLYELTKKKWWEFWK